MISTADVPAGGGLTVVRRFARAALGSSGVLGTLSVLVVLGAWEVVGRQYSSLVSHPTAVASALVDLAIIDGSLLVALGGTLYGAAVGFAISALLGTAIGFAMGRLPSVAIVLEPYVNALYATPRIALIPLLILWAGIGFGLRVTVAVLIGIFPVIVNTYVGSRSVDSGFLDVGRSFNAGRLRLFATIIVPASLPYVLTGLRLGAFRSLVGVVVAEIIGSLVGVGKMLLTFGQHLETANLVATIISLGIVGLLVMWLGNVGERRAMPWTRRAQRRLG